MVSQALNMEQNDDQHQHGEDGPNRTGASTCTELIIWFTDVEMLSETFVVF